MRIKKEKIKTDRDFLQEVYNRVVESRKKQPCTDNSLLTLIFIAEQLTLSLLDDPWIEVKDKALDLSAIALRLTLEGDSLYDEYRKNQQLDTVAISNTIMRKML